MWIQAGALQPVPSYAVVGADDLAAIVLLLAADADLKHKLAEAFRRLEHEQPALADLLSGELSALEEPAAQAQLYFLFLAAYMAFRAAFGPRLSSIEASDLGSIIERLVVDGEVRSQACPEQSYSEDMIAIGQPALMRFVYGELEDSKEDLGDTGPILQVLLAEVLALTHAVAP
jgi:hypothetical protein